MACIDFSARYTLYFIVGSVSSRREGRSLRHASSTGAVHPTSLVPFSIQMFELSGDKRFQLLSFLSRSLLNLDN